MRYELRDYQVRAIEGAKAELRAGNKRVLIACPTGAGKTLVALRGIIEPALAKGRRIWFVAPRKQLVAQTSAKLDELGMTEHGIVQANHWRRRPQAPVQVCSKDTLGKRFAGMVAPDIVIWDEAHHCADDNQNGKIIAALPNAVHIGLTATPCRLDGKGLGKVFDAMVQVTTITELIDLGFLVPPRIFHGPILDLSHIKKSAGDFNQRELGEAMDDSQLIGDIVTEWIDHGEDRPTVCFAVNVEHSKHIVQQFLDRGVPAGHIDASTPDAERERLLGLLRDGRIKVMSSVGVFTEGFDMPCVGCVIFARPTASLSLYIQMAGRGLRPEFGIARPGEHCIFLDHAGLTARHGKITKNREWSLDDGLVDAVEKKPKSIPRCPACYVELKGRPDVCPVCQAQLRSQEGEQYELIGDTTRLVEHTDEEAQALADRVRRIRQEYYREVEEKAFLHDWKPIAVGIKFKARFGEWPSREDRATSGQRIKFVRDAHTGRHTPIWAHEKQGGAT